MFEHTAFAALKSGKALIEEATAERLQQEENLFKERREILQAIQGIGARGRDWVGEYTMASMTLAESTELAKGTLVQVNGEELKRNLIDTYDIFGKTRDGDLQKLDDDFKAAALGAKFTTVMMEVTSTAAPQRAKRMLRNIRNDMSAAPGRRNMCRLPCSPRFRTWRRSRRSGLGSTPTPPTAFRQNLNSAQTYVRTACVFFGA